MTNINPKDTNDAIARRLAKLKDKPVDTTRLEQRLEAALSSSTASQPTQPARDLPPSSDRLTHWLRPAAGLAAVLAVAVTLLVVFSASPPPASAAVIELSDLHRAMIAGRMDMQPVTSIHDVNQMIAAQRRSGVPLPQAMRGARVQSCCLVDVQGDLLAIAILDDGGPPVTLVVAQAPNFAHEMGTIIEIQGRRFFGHTFNGIPMMMANDGDRWLCVMGNRSDEALATIAAKVRF